MKNYNELKISLIPINYFRNLKGKILDIGCNECILPEKLGINKKDYFGLDLDDNALSIAKKKGFNVKKVDIDKEGIPLSLKGIDSFLLLDILEHLQDPITGIKKIKKVLKPNALGIISLPNDLNLVNILKVLLLGRPLLIKEQMWNPHSHLHFPSLNESKKLIDKNFNILSIKYVSSNFVVPLFPIKIKQKLASLFPRFFAQSIVFLVKNKGVEYKK